jgi:hypothetical protein
MASTYSTNLKIELMGTGENSGTWGTITNTNLGTAFEQAVIGLGNPDYTSDANLTITITNSNAAQAARALVLNVTSAFGSLTATRELIVPTIQKQYIVQNNTTGGQSITVKTSAGTGITVPTGRKAHLYVDGTNVIQMFDFVDINGGAIDGTAIGATSASTGAFTSLTASGATTLNGAVALGDASGDLITVPGTVNSNLLFTDATYDIGASGATRPRDMFLSRNLTVGGTLTLAGGVNLNGNVTVGDSSADTLTINSTITSNLIFTDNTYDIGASGATRPRNLFLAGNATIGGAQTLTGALTVDSTTDSTSTTTGSIQTDGGLGVAKALFVGTTANIAGNVTLSGGTANGVTYLNGSKVLTSGSALEFSGTNFGVGTAGNTMNHKSVLYMPGVVAGYFQVANGSTGLAATNGVRLGVTAAGLGELYAPTSLASYINNTEGMRLTSTGLGIGTSSPGYKLEASITVAATTGVQDVAMLRAFSSGSTDGTFGARLLLATENANGNSWPAGIAAINDSGGSNLSALGFYTATSGPTLNERMRIDSSGNVSIGTQVTPGNTLRYLDVANSNTGASAGSILRLITSNVAASGTVAVDIVKYKNGTFSIANNETDAAASTTFTVGASERMRIDSSGNVGIGTSSPTVKLDVVSSTAGGQIRLAGNEFSGFNAYTPTYTSGFFLGYDGSGNIAFNNRENKAITFSTNNTERARITSAGNVGIGTNSPTSRLVVAGGRTILQANSETFALGVNYNSSTGSYYIGATNSATPDMVFSQVGGSENMRLTNAGDLGIGTSSPANIGAGFFHLEVNGSTSGVVSVSANGVRGLSLSADGSLANIQARVSGQPLVFATNNAGTVAERMRIASNGIVTMNAYGAGAATFSAAGVISSVSDETWKTKDGVPVNPDAMLKKLEPGYWYYNDEKKDIFGADRQLGFYAQNVNAAIGPEAAPEPEEGKPWGYYDRSVLAVVVMSLQKALATIESLEARIATLESKP